MRRARYYEIDYAGLVQRAWMLVVLAACWRGTSSSPTETAPPPPPPAEDANALGSAAPAMPPARAALDGRLQIAPAGMCGGARVPDGYRPPPLRPQPGVEIRVLKGDKYSDAPPVAVVTTDKDGTFTAALAPGRYCVAQARGAKPVGPTGQYTDLGCLVERWETCDAVVDVPLKTQLPIDIHEPCAWAVCYHGPPPP